MGFKELFSGDTLQYSYNPDTAILTFRETDSWVYDEATASWSGSYNDLSLETPTEYETYEALQVRLPGEADYSTLFYSVVRGTDKMTEPTNRNQTLSFRVLLEDYANLEFKFESASLIESKTIHTPIEYIILSDSERVCYLPYNAKISSVKTTVLETKTDTIMGGYPFFVRNGNVAYKELPISALLSRQNDFMNSFGCSDDLVAIAPERAVTPEFRSFHIVSPEEDVYLERKYKMAVEEWLRNGQEKVLQTPMEGNYIVRLQNISLSPNDQLARRLHTVSATAIEVAKFNIDNLNKMGISAYLIPLD